MDNVIEDLNFPLPLERLKTLTKKRPLQIIAWQSGDDSDVCDPVSHLNRNTFKITKWLLVLIGALLAFYPLLQKVLRIFGLKPWRLRDLLTRYVCGASIAVIIVIALFEFQPLAIYLLYRLKGALTFTGILGGADKALAIIGSIVAASGGLFATSSMGQESKLKAKIALNAIGVIGPTVLWLFYLNFCGWALSPENVPEMFKPVEEYVIVVFLAVGLATFLISRRFYNVNQTSIHPFYRDRLSKAFLIKPDPKSGKVGHNDEQKLQNLDTSCAPLHIINSTLNVTGKSNVSLKGRNAEFFSFSREYVGSQITGYVRTGNYEAMDNHMGLGTAMAISAAAAAPNMGRETNKSMTFIMALLNIRLGYWARNPLLMDPRTKKSFMRKLLALIYPDQVGPIYLIKEMLGLTNEKSSYINLSDGGHLENMGLYELVRRRCKFIIVGDGEADKDMTFHGLSDAVRMVLIDMGIKIDIDLDRIYRDGKKEGCHYAVGTIHYGQSEEEEGYLLYIKSSVSTKHAPYIEDYMASNPDFPHETTADQFFDEAQFEAYRALGREVGEKTWKDLAGLSNMNEEEADAFWEDKREWEKQAMMQWNKVLKAI